MPVKRSDDVIVETNMLSEPYLKTASTLARVAREMADQTIADRLRALAEHYERQADRASVMDSAGASGRPSVAAKAG